MKQIQIDQDIYNYLVARAAEPGESSSTTLRRELHLAPPQASIEVDDDVYAYLVSKTTILGESASDILRRQLHLGGGSEPDHGHGPTTVEFRIPAGTGASAWNTAEHAVVAAVGDTLRVVNDDAVPHRLHTSGTPFPHPDSEIAPGGSVDYSLLTPFTGALYDHNFGSGASFFIRVTAEA